MSVNLSCSLSDRRLDSSQSNSQQRQLAIEVSAISDAHASGAPLNLCLVLDRSGSMGGRPLDTVKAAARDLIDRMHYNDRISVVAFDHKAKVIVENQTLDKPEAIKDKIQSLKASGGTCIDDGIKLGLQELGKGKEGTIGQAFVLTDGENEHGDNERCLQFSRLAAEYNITLHTLGFGDSWNQDVLESIADAGGGTMAYIASPDRAADEFNRLLQRVQSVGLTNAYLLLELSPNVRLAELKPIAQVEPDAIELSTQSEGNLIVVRLGDLMTNVERVVVVNLYINANSPEALLGEAPNTINILTAQVRYDSPAIAKTNVLSDPVTVAAELIHNYSAQSDPQVQNYVLALAKYRQTQLAEDRLKQGDRTGAVTMLQSAAKTALQMGDEKAATVLQSSATRLQSGSNLSEAERKTTRIVSKTVLQKPSHE
jgi:Ca-activated chloride channel family protein